MMTQAKALAEIEAAKREVYRICRGGERWRMTIPVDEAHDSDRIICHGLEAAERLAREQRPTREEIARIIARDDYIGISATHLSKADAILALWDAKEQGQ